MKKFRLGGGFALAALFFASVFLGSCDDDYWEYPSKTKDSSLTVEINKTDNGDGTADIKAVMHGTDGVDYIQNYIGINTIDPDNFYFRFTVDSSYLVFE